MRLFKRVSILILILFMSRGSFAGTSRKQEADSFLSSDHTKTWNLPSGADTLVGRVSTDTLTNKTIDGSLNTLSKLPVGTQITQYVVTPYPNGVATTFTLSPTPPTNSSVALYLDGALLIQGSGFDYTISSATVTMTVAPATGQNLYVVYSQF